MAEKGVEEQVLAMERLHIIYFLIRIWDWCIKDTIFHIFINQFFPTYFAHITFSTIKELRKNFISDF